MNDTVTASADRHDSFVDPPPTFHDLLLTVIPLLRQQAIALTRNRPDADDLVQAAITSALAAKDSFEMGTNMRAWMMRILRNRFFSDVRRRREMVDIDDAPAAQLGRSGGQEERIDFQQLRRHLQRLPADQRLILLMVSLEGFSYEDASDYLGVAVGTLKSRVFRARTQLRLWESGEQETGVASPQGTPTGPGLPLHASFPVTPAVAVESECTPALMGASDGYMALAAESK